MFRGSLAGRRGAPACGGLGRGAPLSGESVDEPLRRLCQLTLPNDLDRPARGGEARCVPSVPLHGAAYLPLPVLNVGRGHARTPAAVPVPQAPVNEHRRPVPPKHQVRLPREAPIVEPEPEPRSVQLLPDPPLRARVLGAHQPHNPASLSRRDRIGAHVLTASASSVSAPGEHPARRGGVSPNAPASEPV